MTIRVEGKNGVVAEIVQDSISEHGKRITTFNLTYGLIIHAEFLRHRLLSRGVKSNRAIPTKVIRKEVLDNPYVPVFFGGNQPGMVSRPVGKKLQWLYEKLWKLGRYPACGIHFVCDKAGGHKEWVNRLLNPWQYVRETVTATEWDNLFNLRLHKDAQKDIREIVRCMKECLDQSEPVSLKHGEYHVPYVQREWVKDFAEMCEQGDYVEKIVYIDNGGAALTVEQALMASAARCARSSYDNHDKTSANIHQDIELYEQLIESDPKHSSPVEHQATPMSEVHFSYEGDDIRYMDRTEGVTHLDKQGNLWSGNLKGWIQQRQVIPNNACWDYKED